MPVVSAEVEAGGLHAWGQSELSIEILFQRLTDRLTDQLTNQYYTICSLTPKPGEEGTEKYRQKSFMNMQQNFQHVNKQLSDIDTKNYTACNVRLILRVKSWFNIRILIN